MEKRFKILYNFSSLILVTKFIILSSFFCGKNNGTDSSNSLLDGFLYSIYSSFQPDSTLTNSATKIYEDYTDLETNASSFYTAISSYSSSCSSEYTELTSLRDYWKANMAILKKLELIQFGPATQGGYYENIDPYKSNFLSNPPDTTTIESIVSDTSTIDSSSVSSMSKLAKGMPAIEYLLYDDGNGNSNLSSVCSVLTGRRLTLLTELIYNYYSSAKSLKKAWDSSNGNFYDDLANAGKTGGYFQSKKEALDTLISQIINEIENIKDNKLSYPTGISSSSGGTIQVNYIESRYSGNAVTNMQNCMEGVKQLYTGDGGSGVSDYVQYYNPPLDARIKTQIDDVITKIGLIQNFDTSYQSSDQTEVETAIDSLQLLKSMLTTELSATVGNGGQDTTNTSSGDGD